MIAFRSVVAFSILLSNLLLAPTLPARAQAGSAVLELLDRQAQVTAQITDGDQVSLRLTLTEAAAQATPVSFRWLHRGSSSCAVEKGM
jgi:hypothetical protein